MVTSVLNLRKGLEDRGHEVRIPPLSNSASSYVQDGVYYLRSMGAGAVYPNARLGVPLQKKLLKELLAWGPDIVHSNCEFSTFPAACYIAEKANAPLLHTYHTVYENYTHYFSPSQAWGKKVVRHFHAGSPAARTASSPQRRKPPPSCGGYGVQCPLYVIPTGVAKPQAASPAEARILRESLGIPDGRTVLLYLGRLAKEKNCAELLRTMARFLEAPVTLLLVGDGPGRKSLEKLSQQMNLDGHVVFAGMVPPDQVGRYYQLGDLFVSASTSETQGLTYLEALRAGLPLLCRRDACLDGVVEQGVNGWQYTEEDDFAACVEQFLTHPEHREQMERSALVSGQRFSV